MLMSPHAPSASAATGYTYLGKLPLSDAIPVINYLPGSNSLSLAPKHYQHVEHDLVQILDDFSRAAVSLALSADIHHKRHSGHVNGPRDTDETRDCDVFRFTLADLDLKKHGIKIMKNFNT